jgi:hypothetical protein
MQPQPLTPRTAFDWKIYAQATFAGLSPLIPVPILDWIVEEYFRRRMPQAIAHARGYGLSREVVGVLNRGGESCLASCLVFPLRLLVEILKSLSRKLLYVLSIKEASDRISYYWHQAFLMDYMLMAGHLGEVESAVAARQAMDRVLRRIQTSPLEQLAGQVVESSGQILRRLRRARQNPDDPAMQNQRRLLTQRWREFSDYLTQVAVDYHRTYLEIRTPEATEEN